MMTPCSCILVLVQLYQIFEFTCLTAFISYQNYLMSFNFRATALKEELANKAAALSDMQQQLKNSEQDRATLKVNIDKVTEEHAKLDKKAQSLAEDFQKAQQAKEAQKKELNSTQESLGKAKKSLKETQSLLDTERKNHKAALEEKVCSEAAGNKITSVFSVFLFLSVTK